MGHFELTSETSTRCQNHTFHVFFVTDFHLDQLIKSQPDKDTKIRENRDAQFLLSFQTVVTDPHFDQVSRRYFVFGEQKC